jgi:hypothetical protein
MVLEQPQQALVPFGNWQSLLERTLRVLERPVPEQQNCQTHQNQLETKVLQVVLLLAPQSPTNRQLVLERQLVLGLGRGLEQRGLEQQVLSE